ncbi:MAG TPA: hypothetical protein VKV25_10785, partial [Acidimicrobiales bacterium]|nr:hypothetical protein [Acidimicrobiales bacterium]
MAVAVFGGLRLVMLLLGGYLTTVLALSLAAGAPRGIATCVLGRVAPRPLRLVLAVTLAAPVLAATPALAAPTRSAGAGGGRATPDVGDSVPANGPPELAPAPARSSPATSPSPGTPPSPATPPSPGTPPILRLPPSPGTPPVLSPAPSGKPPGRRPTATP